MEHIVSEIVGTFIKNIVETLSAGVSLEDIEEPVYRQVKVCACSIVSAFIETVNEAIIADKAARHEAGYIIERHNDERRMHCLFGELTFSRTFFKKAAGGYEYLADTAFGIEPRSRLSTGTSLALVKTAKEVSYGKAAKYVTSGAISRQTVMGRVRRCCAVEDTTQGRRRVVELHIDADEDHVTLIGGVNTEVPLISVYEGIGARGKRTFCNNIFHISEYGKTPDELWEQALTEIERRYDLTDTKIYLHGDGANWVQKGLEWIPNAIFVLDKYHKNKAIKVMTAGLDKERRKQFNTAIREALSSEDIQFYRGIVRSLCDEMPERADKIWESAVYLANFVKGISICDKDPCANNGGCTEPHVSHILSARLSSRPMAWSKQTLKQLAPILAANQIAFQRTPLEESALPKPLIRTAAQANKKFKRKILKCSTGFPHPDAIGKLPISGKRTGTQVLLKLYS